ncbi:unnamed protein product [Candidatus Paraburkholderia kirkii UZHbot1]|uniref:WGS project CAFE00000000 data, contig bkir_c300 n=2 Tax=Candidatus Paraburkholderia kirkii UZHbot1 TaxID=1055526 RepID=U3UAU2_9BURK|nr:unnamed protein product [Candidatus Paraburkholderia kirkii UZHbot1]
MVFEFAESRAGSHPLRYLQESQGSLQEPMRTAGMKSALENRRHRRSRMLGALPSTVFESAKTQSKPGRAAQALQSMAQLYAIESQIHHQTPDIKYAARQTEALPGLAKFRQWLAGNVIGLPAQAPLAQAFGYALRQWSALIRHTESGILMPDNNALERHIRPIALGRANWTFAGSPRGGKATATMYFLLGTARLNGFEPYAWLKDTLEKLLSYPVNRVHA